MRPRLNMIWRLFFIQNSRNARTLDGLGFLHVLTPLLRELADSEEELDRLTRRYTKYFNANPILASYIAGVLTNLEIRKKAGGDIPAAHIERVKSTLSSVLTARGDDFFEIVLIPLALTIGCIFAMYNSYLGPIFFLFFYNFYHLRSRIGGYRAGVMGGEEIGRDLTTRLFRERKVLGGCAAFVSGVFAALVFTRAWSFGGPRLAGWGIVAIAALLGLRKRFSVFWTVLIVFLATALFVLIW
ncbi:MAG: PTS system mannose/fructose/sorbose family transporter subunit IID [Candidatus Krumholzibacteriota bacterium]|nr:PTS system mannose/fructose/sorbose family transporter subunit IID [Candidatus Krumholzibacteriota bacterium]